MLNLEAFYHLAQAFISLIGASLLFSIYSNIKARYMDILIEDDSQKRVDKGLLYLGFALLTWVIIGVAGFIEVELFSSSSHTQFFELNQIICSILNNFFILMALFYFYYAPAFIYQNIKNVKLIIGLILGVAIATLILFFTKSASVTNAFLTLPDFLLSAFLSVILASALVQTFLKRGFKIIAIISAIVMALMIGSQLNEVFPEMISKEANLLLLLVSKSSLISIFLLLATSWVIRLSSTPKIKEMQLKFVDWSIVRMSIPSKNILNQEIDFKSKTTQFKNLLKFSIRRKYGEGEAKSISVGKAGEISNQSYLNRIINDMNEALLLDDTQKLDRRDLFTFIGESKYRIRILPEHLEIDEALLEEFIKSSENTDYQYFNI